MAAFEPRDHNPVHDHSAKNLRSVEGEKALARPDDLSPYSSKAQKSKSPNQPSRPRKQHNTRNKNSNARAAIRYVGGQRKKPGLAVQANSSFTPDTLSIRIWASSLTSLRVC